MIVILRIMTIMTMKIRIDDSHNQDNNDHDNQKNYDHHDQDFTSFLTMSDAASAAGFNDFDWQGSESIGTASITSKDSGRSSL